MTIPQTAPGEGAPPRLSSSRRALRWLTLALVLVLVAGSAGFAWQFRAQQIDAASTLGQRRVERLAAMLSQTLSLGDLAIRQTESRLAELPPGAPVSAQLGPSDPDRRQLLLALSLPLEVHALDATGAAIEPGARPQPLTPLQAGAAAGTGWQVLMPPTMGSAPAERRLRLLRPASTPARGIAAFALDLSYTALVDRFEAVRQLPGGAVTLFRIEPDGSGIRVLARAPAQDADIGKRLTGPLFRAVQQRPVGWFQDETQIDGHQRVVAYQRLAGPHAALLLAYGQRTDDLLVAWHAALPWQAAGTAGLVLLALWGVARMDRAMRAAETAAADVQASETRLRTLADNLPDVVVRYDRDLRHLYANPAVERATGLKPADVLGRTLADIDLPKGNVAAWAQWMTHAVATGRTERLEFTFAGPHGPRRWESLVVPELQSQGQTQTVLVISRDITERRRQAQALVRSELRFRLAASFGQVWEWHIGAGEVIFPPAWWQALGHTVPPLAQTVQAFEALLHPDDQLAWRQALRDHLQHDKPYRLLFRVCTALGDWRWMQTQGQCTRDAAGRADYMAGTTFDDTDHQVALQALHSSRRRLSDLLANSPAVIYTALPEGDYAATYYTPNVQALLGYAPQRFVDEPGFWLSHIHPDDRYTVLARLERLPQGGHLVMEYRFLRQDGQWRWLRDDVRVSRDDAGQAVELIGSLVDVTDRRQAEEDLRRLNLQLEQRVRQRTAELEGSERRLAALFDTVPVALSEEDWSAVRQKLLILREQGVRDAGAYFAEHPAFVRECLEAVSLLRVNQRSIALQHLQALPDGGYGLSSVFEGTGGLESFAQELEALWSGQHFLVCKRTQHTPDGGVLQLMLSMSLPTMDAASDGIALVSLVDITEIDRLNAELDLSVASLRRINRELETFTYSVSHDLKAPLRGIDGYSQLLLRDHAADLPDEARAFLGSIRQATRQMGQLIDDLLAYSRMERRSQLLVPVPLRDLVQQVLSEAAAATKGPEVELRNEVPPGLQALGDAQGLRMALRNVVDNALKFRRPGLPAQVVVDASIVNQPGTTGSGDVVRLRVQDNGIGFDMKFKDRIFGIFQRLHRAELYPGTGVGLAIVRKAMDRMGGTVDAHSEPGQGAVFNLDLPAAP